jgi:hypothetical protein
MKDEMITRKQVDRENVDANAVMTTLTKLGPSLSVLVSLTASPVSGENLLADDALMESATRLCQFWFDVPSTKASRGWKFRDAKRIRKEIRDLYCVPAPTKRVIFDAAYVLLSNVTTNSMKKAAVLLKRLKELDIRPPVETPSKTTTVF